MTLNYGGQEGKPDNMADSATVLWDHDDFKLGERLFDNIREDVNLGNHALVICRAMPPYSNLLLDMCVSMGLSLFPLCTDALSAMTKIFTSVFDKVLKNGQERQAVKTARPKRLLKYCSHVFLRFFYCCTRASPHSRIQDESGMTMVYRFCTIPG